MVPAAGAVPLFTDSPCVRVALISRVVRRDRPESVASPEGVQSGSATASSTAPWAGRHDLLQREDGTADRSRARRGVGWCKNRARPSGSPPAPSPRGGPGPRERAPNAQTARPRGNPVPVHLGGPRPPAGGRHRRPGDPVKHRRHGASLPPRPGPHTTPGTASPPRPEGRGGEDSVQVVGAAQTDAV